MSILSEVFKSNMLGRVDQKQSAKGCLAEEIYRGCEPLKKTASGQCQEFG